MTINNCIISFNLSLAIGTSSDYGVLAQNSSQNKFENITIQMLAEQEYSNSSWFILGQNLSHDTYKNIVFNGDVEVKEHNYHMTITVLAYTMKYCIIKNIHLSYDILIPTLGQLVSYQFLVLNDEENNQISNFLYVGMYINSTTMEAFQPNGVQSGLRQSPQYKLMYGIQLNRFTYNTNSEISLTFSNLREKKFMEALPQYDASEYYYTKGINNDFPRFKYVFQSSHCQYESYIGFNTDNTELISGNITKNHFQPKSGQNLCQMDCQGSWTFWDKIPVCKSGYKGPLCEIYCNPNSCQNGGKCIPGMCQCAKRYSGELCQIKHCEGCSSQCDQVLGDTYQCGRSCIQGRTCIQGNCINDICVCNVNVTSESGNQAKCNKTDSCIFGKCGQFGICLNETCFCKQNISINIKGICREITHPELGECRIIDSGYECIQCLNNKQVPLCMNCIDEYKEYNNICYPACKDCRDDCIKIASNQNHCFSCLYNCKVPDCKVCITDHKEVDKVCYEITNIDKGDCWLKSTYIICSSCLHIYNLPECISCKYKFIEYKEICYPSCPSIKCHGIGCFMLTSATYKCALCDDGFQMPECRDCKPDFTLVDFLFYEIANKDKGFCWIKNGLIYCKEFYNNYTMPFCSICKKDFVEKGSECLLPCNSDVCFGQNCLIQSNGAYVCDSCNIRFQMPGCSDCAKDYIFIQKQCFQQVNKERVYAILLTRRQNVFHAQMDFSSLIVKVVYLDMKSLITIV
uniref:Tenascin n=1 Tax=Spironucleus salmonicida TaxID=348837 RepID=V6LHY7_9EUKA|eukprot:EST44170.1 Tenascin [Spironucleus salmonicida]